MIVFSLFKRKDIFLILLILILYFFYIDSEKNVVCFSKNLRCNLGLDMHNDTFPLFDHWAVYPKFLNSNNH